MSAYSVGLWVAGGLAIIIVLGSLGDWYNRRK